MTVASSCARLGGMDRLHRMEEAAGLLGIHPQTLRAWDVQGKIRVVRTPGGKRRVPESEIRRLQGEGGGSCSVWKLDGEEGPGPWSARPRPVSSAWGRDQR